MVKFLVAALAVAPLTLSNHYEQGAFIASSALAVAIAAGARTNQTAMALHIL